MLTDWFSIREHQRERRVDINLLYSKAVVSFKKQKLMEISVGLAVTDARYRCSFGILECRVLSLSGSLANASQKDLSVLMRETRTPKFSQSLSLSLSLSEFSVCEAAEMQW